MKTINYRLQTEIEHLTPLKQTEWFKHYLTQVLESDKPYYVKADYVALSFIELDHKLEYLANEIKALTALKKKLSEAKTLGLEITAEMLTQYGIDKMEGTAISSLTITPSKTRFKENIRIKDPEKVMSLGYVSYTVDTKAVQEAVRDMKLLEELDPYLELDIVEETTPPRLKINKKRATTTTTDTAELLEEAA